MTREIGLPDQPDNLENLSCEAGKYIMYTQHWS